MSLVLGKQFDRNYNIRLPFLNGYYNIYIFFSKKSPLILYNIEKDSNPTLNDKFSNVKMFKNLTGSDFCETFLNLHNFRKSTLDIINQFHEIKSEFTSDVSFICNESINLSKVNLNDRIVYDILTIYGFTLSSYIGEFIFIISERQNINQRVGKKIVRTTGLQISTTQVLNFISDVKNSIKNDGILGLNKDDKSYKTIKFFDDEDS